MLMKIVIGIVVVIIVFLIIVAMRPEDFRVQRSATINAPASTVFAQVNDFHKWDAWSPWAKLDPACKNTFEGATEGKGAAFRWAGNKEVGEGHMAITDSTPNELIRIRLEFIKPFAAVNTTEFAFKPEGDKTTVTWSMFGKNNFMAKAVGLFMDCDKMVGGQFEKGLASMKSISEASAK